MSSKSGIRCSSSVLTHRHGIRGCEIRNGALGRHCRAQRLSARCQQEYSGQGGGRRQAKAITFSSRHAKCEAAFPELLGKPEQGGASSLSFYSACLSISTVLTAGPAQANGDAMNTSLLQQAISQGAEQHTGGLILADFSLLPSFDGAPFQILGFLLHHPFVTLALALAVNYVLPRAFRAAVRFLVIPLVLGAVAWVALQNPSAACSFARGAFDCELHPLGYMKSCRVLHTSALHCCQPAACSVRPSPWRVYTLPHCIARAGHVRSMPKSVCHSMCHAITISVHG